MYEFSKIYLIYSNFLGKHIAYSNNVLYIANSSTIFVLDVKHTIEAGEVKRLELGN